MSIEFGLNCLLFCYGFTLSYHLMGMAKWYVLKGFDWSKAGLGLMNELGFLGFWLLIYLMPNYIDTSLIGTELNLSLIVNTIMIVPLVQSIKQSYLKAIELKKIDLTDE